MFAVIFHTATWSMVAPQCSDPADDGTHSHNAACTLHFIPRLFFLYFFLIFCSFMLVWGLRFWVWGIGVGFWGWGFQLIGFGACGARPSGFFGVGAPFINIPEQPWEKKL